MNSIGARLGATYDLNSLRIVSCKARLAILYVMDSSEDPEVAHEDFLYLVTGVARDIEYFGPKATPQQICDYLNDWHP